MQPFNSNKLPYSPPDYSDNNPASNVDSHQKQSSQEADISKVGIDDAGVGIPSQPATAYTGKSQRTAAHHPTLRDYHEAVQAGAPSVAMSLEQHLQTHNVDTLPSIEQYHGTDATTKTVGQGEAHFLSGSNSDIDGLYTGGASTCLILIAVAKKNSEAAETVAMTHSDGFVKEEALDKFFAQLPSGKMEVTLLDIAMAALKAANKAGATVVFADAGNVAKGGSYCAAVDQSGQVYFGRRPSLDKRFDKSRFLTRISTGVKSGNQLPLDKQLHFEIH